MLEGFGRPTSLLCLTILPARCTMSPSKPMFPKMFLMDTRNASVVALRIPFTCRARPWALAFTNPALQSATESDLRYRSGCILLKFASQMRARCLRCRGKLGWPASCTQPDNNEHHQTVGSGRGECSSLRDPKVVFRRSGLLKAWGTKAEKQLFS